MQATSSWCEFLRAPFGPVAKMSAQSSLFRRTRISRFVLQTLRKRNRACNCAHNFHRRSLCAQTTLASAHYAERCTANPERPARNSARTPRGRTTLLASIRRGLLGFCGTGVPYPAAPRSHSVLLCSGSEDPSNYEPRGNAEITVSRYY
jgi:hypothetical protein